MRRKRTLLGVSLLAIFAVVMVSSAVAMVNSGHTLSPNLMALVALTSSGDGGAGGSVDSKIVKDWQGDGNNLDLSKLRVGDIIAVSGAFPGADLIVPGHYSHVAMYIGNGMMIEAWETGVRIVSIDMIHNADDAAIYRVRTSDSVKQAAVNWALTKVGLPYDFIWLTYIGGKQVEGNSYYCSELVWAAYKAVGGPDIDQNPGWSWKYGFNVAPQEICDDGDTYLVAYSS